MINDVSQRVVKIRNEIKAQKVARELAYSQLLLPENTPSLTQSGNIPIGSTDQNGIVRRYRVRFTRLDGVEATPYVDFSFNLTLSPTYAQYSASQGITVSGNDVNYVDEQCFVGYVASSGSDYVDFYVDITEDLFLNFDPNFPGVSFSFTVEGISTVPGQLTATRLI